VHQIAEDMKQEQKRYVHAFNKDKDQTLSRLSLVYPKLKISPEVYRREKTQKLAQKDSNPQKATKE